MLYKTTGKKSKQEDIFWRKEFAGKIYRLIENIWNDGFVLSINSWWGEGKTTFLKDIFIPNMEWTWYKNQIVYFDAFEHDFFNSPLTAITWSFLKWVWIEWKEELKDKAKNFLKIWGKVLLRYAMRWDIPELNETEEADIEKSISDFAVKEISNYLEAEKWIWEFKNQLENYTKDLEKPLVFIIDELDRCKPSFALEAIEIIKHFFSIKNVVFILSINKEQITSYISHQYGNSSDSENYLHKFIDIETELPNEANLEKYLQEMIKRNFFPESKYDFSEMQYLIKWLDLSLREFEKVCNYIKLMYLSSKWNLCSLEFSFLLSYLKVKKYSLFKKMLNGDLLEAKLLHNELKTWIEYKDYLKNIIEYVFNPNCEEKIRQENDEWLWRWIFHWDHKNTKFLNHHLNLLKNFS